MALEKLSIEPEGGARISVMFNPNSYTINKTVVWGPSTANATGAASTDIMANAPTTSFGGGGSRQLSLDLFFDVTESPEEKKDVRVETDKIVKLTRIVRNKDNPRPPVCTINWGDATTADFPFKGTVSSLIQRFMLFHESGRPLRATLAVSFTEFLNLNDDKRATDPELTTRIVRRGDTLASIAADVYRNPTLWRVIAEANRIEDPLRVAAGMKLTLPRR